MQNEHHSEHWIPVKTSSGMFSAEYAIELKQADGKTVSLFVDKRIVETRGGQSKLKVTLINSNPQNHIDLVLLPSETLETGTRWVEISSEKTKASFDKAMV